MDALKYTINFLLCSLFFCKDLISQDTLPTLQAFIHTPTKQNNDSLIKPVTIKRLQVFDIAPPSILTDNPVMAFNKSLTIPGIPAVLHQPLLKMGNTQLALNYSTYGGAVSNSSFSSDVTVLGMPVDASYHTGMNEYSIKDRVDFSSFKFDKDEYIKSLQSQLRKISQTDDIFKDYLKELYGRREAAVKKIKGEVGNTLKNMSSRYSKGILDKFNIDNLSKEDPGQLLQHIISNQSGLLKEKKSLLEQVKLNADLLPRDSINQLNTEVSELTKAQKLLKGQSDSLQQSWMQKGVVQTLRSFEKEKGNAINELLKKPEVIAELAEKHLHLNGLKKILLNMRSIKAGASGTEHNDMIQGQHILKGVDLDYVKKGKSFAPVLGSMQGIQNVNDLSYSNFNELANTFTSGLRMGKVDAKKDFSQVSFFMFQQRDNGLPESDLQQAFNKNFVFSVNRKISFGSAHILQAEVSKSTMMYGNALQGEKDNLTKGLAGQNFFDNMGVDLTYNGTFESIGLQNELIIRYKGNEYSSLGNSFAVNGAKEVSNSVRKSFYANRLIVSVKGQMREFSLGSTDSRWRNMSYVADIKLKYKKGEFIEFRIQPAVSKRIERTVKYTASKSSRISMRGNINRKVGRGFTYRNYIDLTALSNAFADRNNFQNTSARSLIITSLQNIQIGKRNLFVNTILNKASNTSGYVVFNSSVNLDAGTLYTVKNLLSLSTSLAYSYTDMLYTQIAIRQSVSAEVGTKISVSAYINAGKNIKTYSTFHIPAVSGTVSFRYTLN